MNNSRTNYHPGMRGKAYWDYIERVTGMTAYKKRKEREKKRLQNETKSNKDLK